MLVSFMDLVHGLSVTEWLVLVVLLMDRAGARAAMQKEENVIRMGWDMDAIAACVVGGVSFTGGIGKISGVVTGVLIFTSLTYSLTILGIDTNLQFIFEGIIILAAVTLDCLKYVQKK